MESNTTPLRRSNRWRSHDYRTASSYFVTICTASRHQHFGAVENAAMVLSDFGSIVDQEWHRSCELRQSVVPHLYCVMPNHVHLLFSINKEGESDTNTSPEAPRGLQADSVGSIVGGYKAAVSRAIRIACGDSTLRVWQRNYHDHVEQKEKDFDRIAEYIVNNPAVWENDRFHPDMPW
mgnify:FL=1